MTSSASRGNPLSVMLIVSAIDVLLCAFTATITLFFLGGGQATGATQDEVGWGGVLVITRSEQALTFATDFPNDVISPPSLFRLTDLPTSARPARFRVANPTAGTVAFDVTIVRQGRTATTRITCDNLASNPVFRVDDRETPVRPEGDCR